MDKLALVRWKLQVFEYQQRTRESQLLQQVALFDVAPAHCDPDKIDSFSLALQSMAFWRFPVDSPSDACIYFIIDSAAGLLLYIGETCRSNLGWKEVHDCKQYIENYQSHTITTDFLMHSTSLFSEMLQ